MVLGDFMRNLKNGIVAMLAVVVMVFAMPAAAEEVQLTPEEVRETFVGTPWHSRNGAFLFKETGTYTYKQFDKFRPRGEWAYKMKEDGTLAADSTSYTFYRDGDDYRYYHSRSGRFYKATPNRTFP